MQKPISFFLTLLLLTACKPSEKTPLKSEFISQLTLAFGSCNKPELQNQLWDDVYRANPDIWIWGGDNVYADTEDMQLMAKYYEQQSKVSGYRKLVRKIPVIGTWDDHDYGLNDAGEEFVEKAGSQQAFLDFLKVPKESPRRKQEGIYASHVLATDIGSVKIIVLDTRFFRTSLIPDEQTQKRFRPNPYGEGIILGEVQWQWLEKELTSSASDFNLVVSSIQFLSDEHGFECWGNFPHEVDRFKKLILKSGAKRVLMLSGDRHISEFSKLKIDGLSYPLIDFTSSGLTHSYENFKEENNPYRVGQVVSVQSFGLIRLNFEKAEVQLQMIGDQGKILQELRQSY